MQKLFFLQQTVLLMSLFWWTNFTLSSRPELSCARFPVEAIRPASYAVNPVNRSINLSLMEARGTLTVQVRHSQGRQGQLAVAIFNEPNKFPQAAFAYTSALAAIDDSGLTTFSFPDLPFGKYAVAVFQDLNGNGKLDTNLMGIPIEPYGFSNDIRAKWSSPTFSEAQFSLQHVQHTVTITVKMWKEW